MHHFESAEVLPGVYHIKDIMGVCMTLLVGENRALLIDAGYGLEDVAAFVATLTDKPVTFMLTHGHHDHALGAQWFDQVMVFPQERTAYETYTQEPFRTRVAGQAAGKSLTVPDGWMERPVPAAADLAEGPMDLGGMTAEIILCPGHTPGSAVIYVPERQLLLTGDDWNPCTWAFFPESMPAETFRRNVMALLQLPFTHVLCSHQHALQERATFEAFITGLTDEALLAARKVDMGWPLDTREASPAPGQIFVFDFGKTAFGGKEDIQ